MSLASAIRFCHSRGGIVMMGTATLDRSSAQKEPMNENGTHHLTMRPACAFLSSRCFPLCQFSRKQAIRPMTFWHGERENDFGTSLVHNSKEDQSTHASKNPKIRRKSKSRVLLDEAGNL